MRALAARAGCRMQNADVLLGKLLPDSEILGSTMAGMYSQSPSSIVQRTPKLQDLYPKEQNKHVIIHSKKNTKMLPDINIIMNYCNNYRLDIR